MHLKHLPKAIWAQLWQRGVLGWTWWVVWESIKVSAQVQFWVSSDCLSDLCKTQVFYMAREQQLNGTQWYNVLKRQGKAYIQISHSTEDLTSINPHPPGIETHSFTVSSPSPFCCWINKPFTQCWFLFKLIPIIARWRWIQSMPKASIVIEPQIPSSWVLCLNHTLHYYWINTVIKFHLNHDRCHTKQQFPLTHRRVVLWWMKL